MIWLTWRQFRAQTLVAAGALAVLALYLVYLGCQIRDVLRHRRSSAARPRRLRHRATRTFGDAYGDRSSIVGALLIAVPRSSGSSGARRW